MSLSSPPPSDPKEAIASLWPRVSRLEKDIQDIRDTFDKALVILKEDIRREITQMRDDQREHYNKIDTHLDQQDEKFGGRWSSSAVAFVSVAAALLAAALGHTLHFF